MKKMNKKGFTIVELVIVIAVIAILAAVLIPTFSSVVGKANESSALQEATSAMKTTLAQSKTATLADNTLFMKVGSEKVSYTFKYSGNKLNSEPVEAPKTTDLPDKYNTVIVKSTDKLNALMKVVFGELASDETYTVDNGCLKKGTDETTTVKVLVNVDYPEDMVVLTKQG